MRSRTSFSGSRGVVLACAVLGAGVVAACSSILGVQDGILDTEAGADGGPQLDATQNDSPAGDASAQDAGADVAPADGSADTGIPCSSRTVDVNTGVFVAKSGGADQPSCGSIASPCASIGMGITQAGHSHATTVYVATGTYTEQLTVPSGLTIEGAWSVTANVWTPVCGIASVTAVSVELPAGDDTVVMVSPGATGVTLRYLGILGNVQTAAASQSLYGVFGQSAEFTLDTIAVTMGSGGAGTAGNVGANQPPASPRCANGSGTNGNPASDTPPATPPGTFGPAGYVPSTGATGASDGGTGSNGGCSTAGGYSTCACSTACTAPAAGGCGGYPGLGGAGGQGGGSSIAVYGWNSRITILGGTFIAGNGGNGGNGGDGGPGGPGGPGSPVGAAGYPQCGSCSLPTAIVDQGQPGGTGGAGGHGGGGAGGSSYAIFAGGDAGTLTVLSSPALSHGEAGAGGYVNGAAGQAADQGPSPSPAPDAGAGAGPSDAAPDDGG